MVMHIVTTADEIIEAANRLHSLLRRATSPAPGTPTIAPEDLDRVAFSISLAMGTIAGALVDAGFDTEHVADLADAIQDQLTDRNQPFEQEDTDARPAPQQA